MVGFFSSPTIEGAIKEEKKVLTTHLLSDSKNLPLPNDPLDPCQPEPEDVPSSFCDSFIDFDSLNRWLMEDNSELTVDPINMADMGVNTVDSELSVDQIFKKVEAEEDLLGLGQENEETRVGEKSVEMGVCEKIHLEGPVSGGDVPGGEFGCLIEERLGSVSLAEEGNNGNGMTADETVGDKDESDDSSEDESSSSSSSSSDSSSSDEEEGEDSEAMRGEKKVKKEEETDLEEGEIMLSDTEGLVGWSDNEDDEDESVMTGPIKSKNELTVLPPVPSVSVTLEPHHQTLPVGVILSIVGAQVIVEGVEKHNPLSESSILWITESRLPLGIIDEIFGPVKNPYYIVRYNSESEVPAGIEQGTLISFVQEFANHVLNDKSLYQKGYDASGENDEELSDELEFSDDEKEAEYRKMIKMKKRGKANESKPGNRRKEKKQQNNRNSNSNRNQGPAPQKFSSTQDHHSAPSNNAASLNQENSSRSSGLMQGSPFPQGPQAPDFASGPRPGLAGNQAMITPFPCGPGFIPPNGIWNNGFPQQQNMSLPNGLPGIGMPWMQQNRPFHLFQTPLQMNMAFQQQIGQIPIMPLNFNNGLGGQPNFVGGPMLTTPWPTNPVQFGMGLQAPLPMNGSGEQGGQQSQGPQNNHNSQPSPDNSNFSQGRGGGRGRGRHHRGGGRFGGGRGRFQSR
ncbi:hypothetical protein CASFOL_031404 [Castilleja foliolosa]|uniref:H/ACA ribonucleoprotein complex non-core subunit NAF1 n=1 Tax=Castilleja foliolosa TaxID=1961234 RepID=A0ABD3C5W7_9LAMI